MEPKTVLILKFVWEEAKSTWTEPWDKLVHNSYFLNIRGIVNLHISVLCTEKICCFKFLKYLCFGIQSLRLIRKFWRAMFLYVFWCLLIIKFCTEVYAANTKY